MTLKVRFQGGSRAGEVLELDQESVLFGRGEGCHVRFEADQTKVSAQHCAIVRRLGEHRLEIGKENLVHVDGRRASDGERLRGTFDLQLGPDGPTLVVELGAIRGDEETALPGTEAQGPAAPSTRAEFDRHVATGRRGLAVLVLAVVALIGLGGMLWHAQRDVETAVGDMSKETADLGSRVAAVEGRLVVVETDARTLSQETASALRAAQASSAKQRAEEQAVAASRDDVRALGQRMRPSVYLAGSMGSERFEPCGTAWVIGPGVLATNAHVARALEEQPAGARRVRSGGPTPRDHRITGIEIHPGYDEFEQLWQSVKVGAAEAGRSVIAASVGACDVALLRVDDAAALGPALPLATDAELDALAAGDEVHYVGFPMEGLAGGGVNVEAPEAQLQAGRLTSITDEFLVRQAATRQNVILQHNLPAAGGASGSPVADSKGRVIGLLNAVNMHFVLEVPPEGGPPRPARMPLAVGVNFAQRVDFARELLEGRAAEGQQPRTARWRETLERMIARRRASHPPQTEPAPGVEPLGAPGAELEARLTTLCKRLGAARSAAKRVHDARLEASILRLPDGQLACGVQNMFALDPRTTYLVAALSSVDDLDLLVASDAGGAPVIDEGDGTSAFAEWTTKGAEKVLVLVVAQRPGAELELVIYAVGR